MLGYEHLSRESVLPFVVSVILTAESSREMGPFPVVVAIHYL